MLGLDSSWIQQVKTLAKSSGMRHGRIRGTPGERGLEATGGFEPPNRGFADLRLNRLATSPCLSLFIRPGFGYWCRGRDLNPHRLTPTAPSRPRVYQFHHLGPAVRAYYSMYRLGGHPGPRLREFIPAAFVIIQTSPFLLALIGIWGRIHFSPSECNVRFDRHFSFS